jgi:mono/diheme cytochrome c family protein
MRLDATRAVDTHRPLFCMLDCGNPAIMPASRSASPSVRASAIFLAGLLAAGVTIEAVGQSPPAEECPQPRFTGKAPEPYYSQKNPLPANQDLVRAEKIFKGEVQGEFGCAPCHGVAGGGNGPLAGQFKPRPRNFRCAVTINDVPDGQLFWIIRFGSPGTSMPPHRNLRDDEVWEIVSYLRHLAR